MSHKPKLTSQNLGCPDGGSHSNRGPWPRRSGTRTSSDSAAGEPDLLFIDLHLLHEVTSPQAFDGLRLAGRRVRRADLTIATEDHNTPTGYDDPAFRSDAATC